MRVATARDAATFVDEQTARRRVGGYRMLNALRWDLFQDNQHVGWEGGICFRGIDVLSVELPRSIIVHRRHTYCRSALNDWEKPQSGKHSYRLYWQREQISVSVNWTLGGFDMGVSHISSVSRRGVMGRMAVATAAGMVAPALAPVARAAGSNEGLKTFKGRYALRGGRIIDGYFVAPNNVSYLDVVVVLHGENGFDAAARALAHDHARAGKLAIVPDMPATYSGIAALAGRDAHVADIRAMRDAFGRHVRGNGKVEFVSA